MGWNSVLKDLMLLSYYIEIFLIFENQQLLSHVIILKITSEIVLDIRECERILWENFIVSMQKLVSTKREKEYQLHYRFINSINIFYIVA